MRNQWKAIEKGETTIGIELGSTLIKTVLISNDYKPIDSGSIDWKNSYINDIWTYPLDEIWQGLQDILPQVQVTGEPAGQLSADGDRLLDPDDRLLAGIPLCPPEGDAGT
jgi:activator of 2-hydroxyglutaryl-CoA dehydratase